MTTHYEVAIRRPDDRRLLVLADRSLPGFTTDAPPPWQVVTIVEDEIRARFGLDVVTLAGGREALTLARTVLPLHVAALYAERILPGLE